MPGAVNAGADQAQQTSGAELLYAPEPGAWPGLLRTPPTGELTTRFREQLGLPTDRPIVMSGHQAGFWHCGILTKRLAAEALARAANASAAWLVVDHDANDAGAVRTPTDSDGAIGEATARIAPDAPNMPTGHRPADGEPELPDDATAEIGERLRMALAAMPSGADSLASRVHAGVETACARIGCQPIDTLFSLAISKTDLFASVVEHVRTDPDRCRSSYNDALQGAKPLAGNELPLWAVSPGGARRTATDDDLNDPSKLAPKALLMTGLLRAAGADLFIHGTGGGGDGDAGHDGYDAQTEKWFASYFQDLPALCPSVVASATLMLPFPGGAAPTDKELKHAQWLARSAAHNPELLDEDELAAKKMDLVEQAERMKEAGEKPAAVFAEMRALLDDYKQRRANDLAALQDEAERMESQHASAELINDRTWAFVLFPDQTLRALRRDVRRAFGLDQ